MNIQTIWSGCRGWRRFDLSASLFCSWMALGRQTCTASQVCLLCLIQSSVTGRLNFSPDHRNSGGCYPSTHWNGVCGWVDKGILGVFSLGKKLAPVVLIIIVIIPLDPTKLLTEYFCLALRLGMVTWGKTDIEPFSKALPYLGVEFNITAWDYVLRKSIEPEYFTEQDLSSLKGYE